MCFAQSLAVKSFEELTHDLSARTNPRIDEEGNHCALIRINVPNIKNIVFDNTIVGEAQYLPGEYIVYVNDSAPSLSFTYEDNTETINYTDYNISIEGNKCYRLILSTDKKNAGVPTVTTITANYDNMVVLVDGVPVGETPVTIESLTEGKHTISVPNTNGYTMKDSVVYIQKDRNNNIELFLHKEKFKPVKIDIVVAGFDGEGEWIYGTNKISREGKQGIVDYNGEEIVPCIFDYVYPSLQNGYYVVTKEGKKGLYDPEKGLVVPCVFSGIYTNGSKKHTDPMPAVRNGFMGVLNYDGSVLVPFEYKPIVEKINGLEYTVSPEFNNGFITISHLKEGSLHETVKDIFNRKGEKLFSSERYKYTEPICEGFIYFEDFYGGKGLIDSIGNSHDIPSEYAFFIYRGCGGTVYDVENGDWKLRVHNTKTDKYGLFNKNMEVFIPAIYDKVCTYYNGMTEVETNGNTFVVDQSGKVHELDFLKKQGLMYQYTYKNQGNYYIAVSNSEGKHGLYDDQGNVIFPCVYNDGDFWYYDENNNPQIIGIYQNDNNELVIPEGMRVSKFSDDGFIKITDWETKSYGYINMQGDIIANCIYGYKGEDAYEYIENDLEDYNDYMSIIEKNFPVSEGLAILSIGDRYGYINNKGDIVVPLIYTAITPFEDGKCYAREGNGHWVTLYRKDYK